MKDGKYLSWILLGTAFFYTLFFSTLNNAPFLDLPNHLARAHVIDDLLFNNGAIFGKQFSVNLQISPYLAGDLILVFLQHFTSVDIASRIWTTLSLILLPVMLWPALNLLNFRRRSVHIACLAACYLSTSWFFFSGFLNYCISIPLVIWAYTQSKQIHRAFKKNYLYYLLIIFCGYLMHLSALIFAGAAIGIGSVFTLLLDRGSLRQFILKLFPIVALLTIHFLFNHQSSHAITEWGGVASKLRRLGSPFIRFYPSGDVWLFVLFMIGFALPILALRKRISTIRDLELPCIALAFFAIYFALPLQTGGVYDVDNRALPFAYLFLLFTAVKMGENQRSWGQTQAIIAITIAAINLIYIGAIVRPMDNLLNSYRKIAITIPAGALVLPINTIQPIGRYDATTHIGAYATIDSNAITTYLFSGDRNPPMTYFNYRFRPYTPSEFWYLRRDDRVDWGKVKNNYQYILATKPLSLESIPIHYSVVSQNEAAILLKLDK